MPRQKQAAAHGPCSDRSGVYNHPVPRCQAPFVLPARLACLCRTPQNRPDEPLFWDAGRMTIRRKLQLVYALILLSTIGIGALALWSVASWHQASMNLTHSHVQGERLERVRGDIYRQVKEVVDWLTLEDKDADEEFRSLAAVTNDDLGTLEAETKSEDERLAIENLRRSYRGLLLLAQTIFEEPGTNRATMPWL